MTWVSARAVSVSAASAVMAIGLTASAAAAEVVREAEIESFDAPHARALPDEFGTACPELTDSVARLYSAFFLRLPDADGWDYWLGTYADQSTDLLDIAESFVASEEFQLTYGSVDNAEFVRLVYANVLGREPEPAGLAHWTGALDSGYARGSLMLSFSESEEYVIGTETSTPLAGYLLAYAPSVSFSCGPGAGSMSPPSNHKYMDVIVFNTGTEEIVYYLTGLDADGNVLERLEERVAPGFYSYFWNIELAATGYPSLGVDGPEDGTFWHTLVSYPHPHSAERPGWE